MKPIFARTINARQASF